MKSIEQYFERVQSLIMGIPKAEAERYEEQILSNDRGNLRIRLRFFDNSLLEISEAIHIVKEIQMRIEYDPKHDLRL